jgi:hypothetical protein
MWNWYEWDNAELFEIWHSNFIIGKDLGAGSTRYSDCIIDTDGKAKAMVQEEYAEGLVICIEPAIIKIKPIA